MCVCIYIYIYIYINNIYIYMHTLFIIDILRNLVYIVFNSKLTFCKIIFPAQGGSRERILGARTNLQFGRLSQSKKGQGFLIIGVSRSLLPPYIGRWREYSQCVNNNVSFPPHLRGEVLSNATCMG